MKILIPAATAALITGAVFAATGAGAAAPHRAPSTLRLTQLDHDFTYVDVPPKGGDSKPPSGGDELVIGGKIAQGGTSSIVCTVTDPGRAPIGRCDGTLILKNGQISFTGAGKLGNTTTSAITGGTGAYTDATGTLVSQSENSGGKTTLILTLG